MSLLTKYSTPAERARGCRWADRFESQALVEQNGGAVTGAPVFSVANGVTLDGAADLIRYELCLSEFDNDPISIVMEFTPDFNWNEDAIRGFYGAHNAAANARYSIVKDNNAGGNVLIVHLGNTNVGSIPSATYSPYWLQNQRNVLVVSGTTGATTVRLNGNLIMTSAVAWTPDRPEFVYVGANQAGANPFDGTIHSLQIYKCLLTAQEAADFYNQDTYRYMESATGVWQMRAEDHDPVGNRTLDSSGNGYHVTDVSDPVKIAQRHGYVFDGAADYFFRTGVAADPFDPAGDFSVVVYAKTDKVTGGQNLVGKWFETGNHRVWAIRSNNADLYFSMSENGTAVSQAFIISSLAIGKEFMAIGTYEFLTSGTSIVTLYKDDWTPGQITNAGGPCSAQGTSANLQISSRDGSTDDWDGEIYYVAFFDGIVLTPLQVEDIKIRLKNQRNQV